MSKTTRAGKSGVKSKAAVIEEQSEMRTGQRLRLQNLRLLIRLKFANGPRKLCKATGVTPSQLYRYLKEDATAHQYPGPEFCRRVEMRLGLPRLWMDIDHSGSTDEELIRFLGGMPVANGTATGADSDQKSGIIQMDRALLAPRKIAVNARIVGRPEGHGRFDLAPLQGGSILSTTQDTTSYAARVVGHWLAPRIRHGQFLVISPQIKIDSGDDVLVKLNDGTSFCKRVSREMQDAWELTSINDNEPPTVILKDDIEYIHFIAEVKADKTHVFK